ncbi:hypothetical protein LTR84_011047 [Exophiala bonariae]|uniref:alpha-galactosidase n=1 Tax=Exophiala bonariae TaxID=1690606 RepID=A0AAV9NKL7_9EURO|nr:hypothetical protein LTR84_011047 [Exophiala bonariae]
MKLGMQTGEKPGHGFRLRRKLVVSGVGLLAIAIALGVGLGVGLNNKHSDNDTTNDNLPSATTGSGISDVNGTTSNDLWRPEAGTTWNYQLKVPLNNSANQGFQVWDIDLFDNEVEIISGLQQNGSRVICYFSAGSYEDWRSDKGSFSESDLGSPLDGWPGERWINVSSPAIRQIMVKRLDMAENKGCDGVDPDNVDGYDNDNGLHLTEGDAIAYMNFLTTEAHSRSLSIGLKNSGAIIPAVINSTEWSVNEQCLQYNECETYAGFISANKPVFHVEYPKGDTTSDDEDISTTERTKICEDTSARGFSTVIKNIDLDAWTELC